MCFFLLIILTVSLPSAGFCDTAAQPSKSKVNLFKIGPEERCPVCAMQVAKHPRFASAIELTDGKVLYFCGTGCMLRTWMHPEFFTGLSKEDLKRPVVRDYFTGAPIDGRQAIWVAGSDVVGPMGPALVPLVSQRELEAFRRRHGGTTTFRMQELSDELWESITGKPAVSAKQK